jgi:hypothetical protein
MVSGCPQGRKIFKEKYPAEMVHISKEEKMADWG